MLKKSIMLAVSLVSMTMSMLASEPSDSIKFANAKWQYEESDEGIILASAQLELFDSPQSIVYLTYPMESFTQSLVPHDGLKKVSETAMENDALCAINAGYWNMSTDIPATYIRLNGQDLSKTEDIEAYRVNGIVVFDENQFDIGYSDTTQYPVFAEKYETLLTCGPLLIDDGKEFDYSNRGSFFTNRHPRSVIGYTPDGEMILLVVDGRIKDVAAGVSIPELTDICRWLGMSDALNLDGGGSSTLWFMGKVVNHPSDNKTFDHEGERDVSSSIIVK